MYFEFSGGLGDVVNQLHRGKTYERLSAITGEADVVLVCNNPFAQELFAWHPKRHLMNLRSLPYWGPAEDAACRAVYGLPPHSPVMGERGVGKPIEYYAPLSDLDALAKLPRRYAVVAPASGTPDRSLPGPVVEELLGRFVSSGITPVIAGRNYDRLGRGEPFTGYERAGVINLIDRLTVPGTCLLVRNAEALVAGHSSLNAVGWWERVPQLLLYPEHVRQRHFLAADDWSWGMHLPETFQAVFTDPEGLRLAASNFFSHLNRRTKEFGERMATVRTVPYPEEAKGVRLHWPGGRFTLEHDVRLLLHYAARFGGDIVEIGCHRGVTTLELAMAFPDRLVYAVDCPWAPVCSQQEWERVPAEQLCEFARARPNVVPIVKPIENLDARVLKSAGVFFVDGNHTYEGCRRDTELALSLGAKLIAWHDCYDGAPAWVGINEVVAQRAAKNPDGVFRVADSWMAFEETGL